MRIVFLGPTRSSFARVDIKILSEQHDVIVHDSVLGYGLSGLHSLIKITIWSCWHLLRSDALYCWFADYHTVLPSIFARLLGKKVFVVAGGFDIGYEPQINFGARIRPLRWISVKWTFRLSSLILPVSRYAEAQLRKLIPGISKPVEVVYNAVRTDILNEEDALARRDPMAMMISQGDSDVEIRRKGVDVFIEIARSTPDIEFRLIGLAGKNPIVQRASDEIENLLVFPGFVSYEDVIVPTFKSAAAYLQPSIEEAFGVAVVEGMSCGCIPVVAPVAAIPEVVGDVGVYCTSIAEYQNALLSAVYASAEQRMAVRRRSMQYVESARREKILRVIR